MAFEIFRRARRGRGGHRGRARRPLRRHQRHRAGGRRRSPPSRSTTSGTSATRWRVSRARRPASSSPACRSSSASWRPRPRAVIEDVAARQGRRSFREASHLVRDVALTEGRATVSIVTPTRSYDAVRLGLNGAHQIGNAVVAVRVLEAVRRRRARASPARTSCAVSPTCRGRRASNGSACEPRGERADRRGAQSGGRRGAGRVSPRQQDALRCRSCWRS